MLTGMHGIVTTLMKWLGEVFMALQGVSVRQPDDDIVTMLPEPTVLSDFLRLSWQLKVLYGFWAIIALSLIVTGLYVLWLRRASTATILVVGGTGLLFECAVGINLDGGR
jgi:hypothetical protein